MDWSKQAEDIVKNWSEAQQKLWQQMLKSMEGSTGSDMWSQLLASWEANVRETVGAQGQWLENWFASATPESMPEEMKQWFAQGQTMSQQWRETQQQMWQGWFEMARGMKPAGMAEASANMTKEGEKILTGLQNAAQEMLTTQMNMFKMWMPGQSADDSKTEKK